MNTESIGDPADFALAFDETSTNSNTWKWEKEHEIYNMEQAEPWVYYDQWGADGDDWIVENPGKDHPTNEEAYAHLLNIQYSTDKKISDGGKGALSSLVLNRDQNVYADFTYWNKYHLPRFPMLPFPYSPYNISDWTIEYKYDYWITESVKAEAPLAGFYLDSVDHIGKFENYNESHYNIGNSNTFFLNISMISCSS